jgi:flagellar basal body-associated protein FliL
MKYEEVTEKQKKNNKIIAIILGVVVFVLMVNSITFWTGFEIPR